MVYITKYNANRISFSLDKDKVNKLYAEELYDIALWMFSLKEQQWLAAAKMFYQNPEFFIENFFKEVETEKKDDWVFTNTTPAFHYYRECENLISDYFNLKIPVEILHKGEEEKQKFRDWFKENQQLLEESEEKFLNRLEATFLLKNRPRIEDFKADNSGIEEAENQKIEDIKRIIDASIVQMEEIQGSNIELINAYGKRTHLIQAKKIPLDNKIDIEILLNWHDLKNKLKKNLKIYFMLRFNPDLEFKDTTLETIGFKACKSCSSNKRLLDIIGPDKKST
jgi:hypothetical protein